MMMKSLKLGLLFLACQGHVLSQVLTEDERAFEKSLFALAHEYVALNQTVKKIDSDEVLEKIFDRLFSDDFVIIGFFGQVLYTRVDMIQAYKVVGDSQIKILSEELVGYSLKDRCFFVRTGAIKKDDGSKIDTIEVVTSRDGKRINSSELYSWVIRLRKKVYNENYTSEFALFWCCNGTLGS